MVAITLRADLSRGLTSEEIDANFTALNTELGTKVTQAQARSAISVSGSLTYNPTTGEIGFTETPLTSANIVSALGFTPLNKAGGTMTGALLVQGSVGTASLNAAGDQLLFNYNGYNYVTANGAAATLQLQATGANGAVTVSTAGVNRATFNASGLLVAGNMLMTPLDGSARTIGFSGGTNTTLVLQAGGAVGSGANLELTATYQAYLDANTTHLRSVDGATIYLAANGTGVNIPNGALTQAGNQVLHAGNFTSYAAAVSHTHSYAPLTGGGTSGSWPISVTGTAGGVAWSAVSGRPTGEPWFGTVSNCGGVSGGGYNGTGITGGMYLYDEGGNVRIGGTITLTACACACNCSTCCFPLDTEVAMADGSVKPVQDVEAGDKVLSPFGDVIEVLSQIVCPVPEGETTYLVNETTRMTREHLLRGEAGWLAVDLEGYIAWRDKQLSAGSDAGIDPSLIKQARIGDMVLTLDGLVEIKSIERFSGEAPETLMSLELTGNRSFFANGLAVESKTNQE